MALRTYNKVVSFFIPCRGLNSRTTTTSSTVVKPIHTTRTNIIIRVITTRRANNNTVKNTIRARATMMNSAFFAVSIS